MTDPTAVPGLFDPPADIVAPAQLIGDEVGEAVKEMVRAALDTAYRAGWEAGYGAAAQDSATQALAISALGRIWLSHCGRPMPCKGHRSTWQGTYPNGRQITELPFTCSCGSSVVVRLVEPDTAGSAAQDGQRE